MLGLGSYWAAVPEQAVMRWGRRNISQLSADGRALRVWRMRVFGVGFVILAVLLLYIGFRFKVFLSP